MQLWKLNYQKINLLNVFMEIDDRTISGDYTTWGIVYLSTAMICDETR